MVRGRNTNGMVGFRAFFPAAAAVGPPVTNARSVDSDAVVDRRDSATNRCSEHSMRWIIRQTPWCAIHGKNEFHRLNVKLAELYRPGNGIKYLRLLWGTAPATFIRRGPEAGNAECASMFFEAQTSSCVRGPPH